MKVCKSLKSLRALLMPALFFLLSINLYAASSEELESPQFRQSKLDAISIYESLTRSLEDRLGYWIEKRDSLPYITESEVQDLYKSHQSFIVSNARHLSVSEMQEKLESLCNQNIERTDLNLQITQSAIERIQSLNPESIKDHLKTTLTKTKETLQTRQSEDRIPLTIPTIVKTYSLPTQQMVETSCMQRADESAILKVLCSPFSYSEINEFFAPFSSDSVLAGHFKTLEAYVLGLIDTPPLPDHWMYLFHKNNLETAEANRKTILAMKNKSPKEKSPLLKVQNELIDQSTKLLSNELKEIGELELKAEALLEDLATKEAKKSAVKKKKKKKKKKKSKSVVSSANGTPLEVPAEGDDALKEPSSTAQVQSSSEEESEQEEGPIDLKPWEAYPQKKTSSPSQVLFPDEKAPSLISVKRETYDLWCHFYTHRTMEWKDFLPMITQTGFGIEPNGGSIHRLLYPKSFPSHTGRNHLVVHKPHGQFSALGHRTIGYLRQAFEQDFGWSLESFKEA